MKQSSFRRSGRAAALAVSALTITMPALAGDNTWTPTGPDVANGADIEWSTDEIAWMDSMDIIWRSTDAGASWGRVGVTPEFGIICDFAPDPADSSRIFIVDCGTNFWIMQSDGSFTSQEYTDGSHRGESIAASGTRIYSGGQGTGMRVSTDGGANWTDASNGLPEEFTDYYKSIYRLEASPVDENFAWASIWADGVYFTHDGGATWTKGSGLPLTTYNLAAHPVDANIVVAATYMGVYMSTDGGQNWSASNTGISGDSSTVAFASSDGNTLYAGTEEGGVYKSTDGGANWTSVGASIEAANISGLAANLIDKVIVTSWKGSFRSADGGATWDAVTGIQNVSVNDFVQSFSNPDTLFLADYQAGVYVSNDSGASWSLERTGLGSTGVMTGFYVKEMAINESDDSVVIGGDAMHTWSAATSDWQGPVTGTSGLSIQALAISPVTPDNIVAGFYEVGGGANGLMTTVDGGQNWIKPPMFSGETITAVAFAPSGGNVVYAGALSGSIWRSDDAGLSWTEVFTGTDYDHVQAIAVDHTDPDRAFAVFGNGVAMRRTTDGGDTWDELADTNLESLRHVAISPHDSSELLVASNIYGVLRSIDGGDSWMMINDGNFHDVIGTRMVMFDHADATRLLAGLDDLGLAEYVVKPDLSLNGPAGTELDTVDVSGTLTFTVMGGSIPARDVVLTLQLDEGLAVSSLDTGCSQTDRTITCEVGSLFEDIAAFTFTLVASEAGDYSVSGDVSLREPDQDAANNADSWTFTVAEAPASGGGSGGGDTGGDSGGGGGAFGFALLGLLGLAGRRRLFARQ